MGELFRSSGNAGKSLQWCDVQLVMVLDKVTGRPERFSNHNSIGPLADALAYVKRSNWQDRAVIVKMDCIRAYEIVPIKPQSQPVEHP